MCGLDWVIVNWVNVYLKLCSQDRNGVTVKYQFNFIQEKYLAVA